jgi:hypothetical protein
MVTLKGPPSGRLVSFSIRSVRVIGGIFAVKSVCLFRANPCSGWQPLLWVGASKAAIELSLRPVDPQNISGFFVHDDNRRTAEATFGKFVSEFPAIAEVLYEVQFFRSA